MLVQHRWERRLYRRDSEIPPLYVFNPHPPTKGRQYLVGSLSGADASQKVTEAFKGWLSADGNRAGRVKAQASPTARLTSRAERKLKLSEPMRPHSRRKDHRIKATPGITGWFRPRVHIDGEVRHLDVGSSHPGAGEGPKGLAVRQLKRYASWVQNVVRQFGLLFTMDVEICGGYSIVREDLEE